MNKYHPSLLRVGGAFNLAMVLFHLFLALTLYRQFGRDPVYPLLQIFNVSATVFVAFLAYTSLRHPQELATTGLGLCVIALNLGTYLVRGIGEWALAPHPRPLILGACLVVTVVYATTLIGRRHAR